MNGSARLRVFRMLGERRFRRCDAKDEKMIGKENLKSVQEDRRHEKVSELNHMAWLWAF